MSDSHGPKYLDVPPSRLWRDRRIVIALSQSHQRCPCGRAGERRTRTQSAPSSSGPIRTLPPRHPHRIRAGRRVCQTHPRWCRWAGPGACDHSSYTSDCGPKHPDALSLPLLLVLLCAIPTTCKRVAFPYPPPGVAPSRRSYSL